jgi:preprotein translocase subunit SecB
MTEENQKTDSGFKIISIVLSESHFLRTPIISFNDPSAVSNLDINANYKINENLVDVDLQLSYSFRKGEEKQVDATIKMVGVFEIVGQPKLTPDEFGKVNGPAIIYPFIREHLSSLSVKAGLGNLLIPPINFSKKS